MWHISLISPDAKWGSEMTDLLEGYDSHISLVKDGHNPRGAVVAFSTLPSFASIIGFLPSKHNAKHNSPPRTLTTCMHTHVARTMHLSHREDSNSSHLHIKGYAVVLAAPLVYVL